MFAVGLLAAGQASTMTGTMAGQYVLEGVGPRSVVRSRLGDAAGPRGEWRRTKKHCAPLGSTLKCRKPEVFLDFSFKGKLGKLGGRVDLDVVAV